MGIPRFSDISSNGNHPGQRSTARALGLRVIRRGDPGLVPHRRTGASLAVLVGTALLFQAIFLYLSIASDAHRTVLVLSRPATERSALLAFGARFSRFVRFLQQAVPPTATVILPSEADDYVLGQVGIMQYFLIPRRVADCPTGVAPAVCVAGLGGSDTYILAVESFPPPATALRSRDYLAFDDSWGLFVPRPPGKSD